MTNDAKFIYKYLSYIVNPEGIQNCMMGSKVTAKLMAKSVFLKSILFNITAIYKGQKSNWEVAKRILGKNNWRVLVSEFAILA